MKGPAGASLPVARTIRAGLGLPDDRYDKRGRLRIGSPREARDLALRLSDIQGGPPPPAGDIYGAAWIYTAWRLLLDTFGEGDDPFEPAALNALVSARGSEITDGFLVDIAASYADDAVWHGRRTPRESALRVAQVRDGQRRLSGRERTLRNFALTDLAVSDPAFAPFAGLFRDPELYRDKNPAAGNAMATLDRHDSSRSGREPENAPPLATLRRPIEAAPDSVRDQLMYILSRWGSVLGDWAAGITGALDMIEEETRPHFGGGPGPVRKPGLDDLDGEARFSHDHDWMPRVVMVAKNVLVWLDQLSRSYNRPIRTLDSVPDQELDVLASRGFNALWLIGLWERSAASREIKRRMGNPEAAASAYSLFGYDIDPELGGWEALDNLRRRAAERGIRMSSDMVPNHVGIDSDWVRQHPQRLLATEDCPYPSYSWNSDDLSGDSEVSIHLEDHYWNHSDAAVVFRRTDKRSGETKFIYHGNDGTSMPWNDTAQIDFLNPEAREAVIRDILHVARNFQIIRFDAAMVLAKKSIRRLWFPAPGSGGAIPSRSEYALSDEEFEQACPAEFWRDVVDRVAEEIPGTLLLAEAFWMMEGFFVRNLGMHRVYNSAFMNMLRDGRNDEYRAMMKETLAFDPGILQRYVNFMNNPDEETAVEQFGNDDRYFATATLLATLPGLPMIGHGQVEGLSEKYGMEYVKAYRDESPDPELIKRHERELFPLFHRRSLFAGAETFRLYDLVTDDGVNEDVYAFTNTDDSGSALVVVNNAFERASGRINYAAPVSIDGTTTVERLGQALVPPHIADGDWVLLREMLSGLWYLRQAGELRRDGLGIAIDGFGRQLLIDYRYEQETSDGVWSRLASELGGSGTPDPDDAIAQLRLRPLHLALDALVDRSYIEEASRDLRRGRIPLWPERNREVAALLDAHCGLTGEMSTADPTWLNRHIQSRLAGAAAYRRVLCIGSRGLRRTADRRFPENERSDEVILALWAILGSLATAAAAGRSTISVSRLWGLDRWLQRGGIAELGDDMANRLLAAAASEAALSAEQLRLRKPGETLEALMADSSFRDSCGVNTWDGVIWFNGDSWNRSVRSSILASGCDSRKLFTGLLHRRRLRKLMESWALAARDSGYHLEKLLAGVRSGKR